MLSHGIINASLAFHGLGLDLSVAEQFANSLAHWLLPVCDAESSRPVGDGIVFVPHETLFMTGCLARGP